MQFVKQILLAAPFGLFACAMGVQAEDCVSSAMHHYQDAPMDFGNGLVLTKGGHAGYHSPDDAWGATEVKLTNCASGQYIWVRASEQNAYGKNVFDHSSKIEAQLESLASADPELVVDSIAEAARKLGSPVKSSGVTQSETCGCRVYYPELRGDKTQYKA